MSFYSWRRLIALLVLAGGLACAGVPKQTGFATRTEIEATTSELSIRAVELGRETMRGIEAAADSIDARTTDPRIRRNTLLLRVSSVPAVVEASLREDPVLAILDLYAFEVQLSNFLASDAGDSSFATGLPFARRALVRLQARWDSVADSIGAKFTDKARGTIASWARAHPIERLPFTRASVVGDLAKLLREEESSIGASVGGIQASLDRLELRIGLADEFAVKQGIWLYRLAALEMRDSPEAAELRATLSGTRGLIEDVPEIASRERLAILSEVDRQRLATLLVLARERTILLQAELSEREVILKTLIDQRIQVVHDVDSLRVRLVADEMHVVDHFVLRIAELIGALLVVMAIGWWLAVGRVRRQLT